MTKQNPTSSRIETIKNLATAMVLHNKNNKTFCALFRGQYELILQLASVGSYQIKLL